MNTKASTTIVGALLSIIMLTAPMGGMAASEAQVAENSDGVIVEGQQVDDQTATATLVEGTAPSWDEVTPSEEDEISIAGRGASFQAVIQELYTEAFMTGVGSTGETTVTVSNELVEENVNVAYGICGSSCGQRGLLGESDAAVGTSSSPGEDFTLSSPDDVVGESVDVGHDSICPENPNQKYGTENLVDRNGETVCSDRTIWASSDAPPQPKDYAEADRQNGLLLTIPAMIGTVTVSVNLPGVQTNELKLTGDIISDMYLQEKGSDASEVEFWDNERIEELNPNVDLPHEPVIPVHRCDGSGTTFAFVDYLSKASPDGWKAKEVFAEGNNLQTGESGGADNDDDGEVDADENPGTENTALPTGELLDEDTICGDGNPGVAEQVQKNQYSFGYVEFGLSEELDLTTAKLQNADETAFVEPSVETAKNAAAGADLPRPWGNWSDASITYQSDPDPGHDDNPDIDRSYPIGTFSYLWVFANPQQVEQDAAPSNCEYRPNCDSEDDARPEDGDLNEFTDFWSKEEWSAFREYVRFILSEEVQNNVNPAAGLAGVPRVLAQESLWAIENLTPYGDSEEIETNPQTDGFPIVGHHVTKTGSSPLGQTYSIDNFQDRNAIFELPAVSGLDITTGAVDGEYVAVEDATVIGVGQGAGTALDSNGNPFPVVFPQDSNCEFTAGETTTLEGQGISQGITDGNTGHLVVRC